MNERIEDAEERFDALLATPRFIQRFARPFKLYVLTPWKDEQVPGDEWKEEVPPQSSKLVPFVIETAEDIASLHKQVLNGEFREWRTCPIQQQLWGVLAKFAGFIVDGDLVMDPPAGESK